MAAGEAEALAKRTGSPVLILDAHGHPRHSGVWQGNPYVANESALQKAGLPWEGPTIVNGPGRRPYYESFTRSAGVKFSKWRARDMPGRLYLDEDEEAYGRSVLGRLGPFTVVEPNLNKMANPNKQWGKWKQLVKHLPGAVVQLSQEGPRLPGVVFCQPPTFRKASAVLKYAKTRILPEGGLHHAAGALRLPAVVIFGGHTSPENTGYAWHENLYSPDGSPCGKWEPCAHCREAMAGISVDSVLEAVKKTAPEK